MEFQFQTNCNNVDWSQVPVILKSVNMGHHDPMIHKKAFENSFKVVFVYYRDELIGFGRLLSDGAYQGALYDIAVKDAYQGHKLGRKIVERLIEGIEHINVILYASPSKEPFYEKLGFRRGKTAMMRFVSAEIMAKKGFTE